MWSELSREEAIELICRLIEEDVDQYELAYRYAQSKKGVENDV